MFLFVLPLAKRLLFELQVGKILYLFAFLLCFLWHYLRATITIEVYKSSTKLSVTCIIIDSPHRSATQRRHKKKLSICQLIFARENKNKKRKKKNFSFLSFLRAFHFCFYCSFNEFKWKWITNIFVFRSNAEETKRKRLIAWKENFCTREGKKYH